MPERVEGYITVQEAARGMGRSTEQVRRYLREGKLVGQRIGGQWFIREPAVLYRTRVEEGVEMSSQEFSYVQGLGQEALNDRRSVFERINRRREAIRARWEKMGLRLNAAELVRELREEES